MNMKHTLYFIQYIFCINQVIRPIHFIGKLIFPPNDWLYLQRICRIVTILCQPRGLQVRDIPRIPQVKGFEQRDAEQDSPLDRRATDLAGLS